MRNNCLKHNKRRYKIGNVFVSLVETPQRCEFCGEVKETRPYADGGLEICYDCAMKPENEKMVYRNMNLVLDGKLKTRLG